MPDKLKEIHVSDIGMSSYRDAWEFQKKLLNGIKEGGSSDTLILTEHQPTITLGKSADRSDILVSEEFLRESGVELVKIERGGGVTYHGPGQLVAYPIFNLRNYGKDIKRFVGMLEKTMKKTAQYYNLKVETREGKPGLWIENKEEKLGSIGLHFDSWISMHGIAYNISLKDDPSRYINPCGFRGVELVSISDFCDVDFSDAKKVFIDMFQKVFNVELRKKDELITELD